MWPFRISNRSKLRPASSIAFCAASAVALTPPAELNLLRSRTLNERQISLSTLKRLLQSLQIDDEHFTNALFQLADVQNAGHVHAHHLLIVYSLLRRLAFAQPELLRFSLQEVVYFIFTSAAGSHTATYVSWAQWLAFASKFGEEVGGSDSLPCKETQSQLRSAWRRVSALAAPVSFPKFVGVLRNCDGGLLLNIRAMAYLFTSSVVEVAHSCHEVPRWNEPFEESCFLSQYVTHAIATRVNAYEDGSHNESTGSHEMESRRYRQLLSNGDVRRVGIPELKPLPVPASLNHSIDEGSDDYDRPSNAPSERRTDPSIQKKPFSFPQSRSAAIASKALALSATTVCRSSRSTVKSPFHIDFSSITLGQKFGSGAYGDVYRGTFLMTPVAVKVFHINVENNAHQTENNELTRTLTHMSTINKIQRFASLKSQNKYKDFVREVEMMSVVRHPNLVLYMGACGDPCTPLCIISELFTGGSLYEYLHGDPGHCPDLYCAVSFALSIARGMFYLHASRPSILHRDLKSSNVLLSDRKGKDGIPRVVICDFGESQLFGHHEDFELGTASYMSPNVISHEKYEERDDTYSFGILLHEIFTGTVPFEGLTPTQVMFQVVHEGLRPSCDTDSAIPTSIKQLMEDCWHCKKSERPLFHSIISRLDSFEASLNQEREENRSPLLTSVPRDLKGLLPLDNVELIKATSPASSASTS
ncbi:unnamed protein product [Agarophyton chilense]